MRVSKGIPVSALPPAFVERNKAILERKCALAGDVEAVSAAPVRPVARVSGAKAATAKFPRPKSPLEAKFAALWRLIAPDIALEREYRFSEMRKWAADFAHVESRTLIECEGVTRGAGGRHQRAAGYTVDCIKYNEASFAGWVVFRLTRSMITSVSARRIAQFMRERRGRSEKTFDSKIQEREK